MALQLNGKRQTIASIATWVLLLGLVLGAVPPPAVTAAVPATERERAKSSDAAPPTTTIEGKPAARSNAAKAEFTYSSSTPDAIFECALDGGRFRPCKAGGETYAGLSQGRHTFKVRAVDGGTVDPTPDSHTWTVDTTAPKVSRVTPAPRARGIDASTNVTAVFAEGMDPASLTATTFTLNPEGENTPIAAAVTYDAKSKKAVLDPDAALDEGTTYRATIAGKADGATDLAGNPLAASKVWSFTTGAPKDTTPPQTTISAQPAARTDTTEATFAYASSEANARFACALDGGRFAPCPAEGESYRGLRPGKHSFKVRAVDAAGNADPTPASHAWTIEAGKPASERTADAPDRPEDTPAEQPSDGSGGAPGDEDADSPQQDETPPETTIERQLGKRTANAETDFAYASSEEGSSFECKLDGERFQACAADGHSYRAMRDGKHLFAVRAVDAAGNTDPTPATYAWTLDTTAPTVVRLAPKNGPRGVALDANIAAVFSEAMDPATLTADTVTLVPRGDETPIAATVSYDAAAKKVVLDPQAELAPGTTYAATVSTGAADLAGNRLADDRTWTFTTAAPADSAPPQTTIEVKPAALTDTTEATFVYASSEPDATFACALDGGRFAPCPATGQSYRGLDDGKHRFKVRAVDAAGNADPTPAVHAWTVDTAPDQPGDSDDPETKPEEPLDGPPDQPRDDEGTEEPATVAFSDGFEGGALSAWTSKKGLRVQTREVATGRYAARASGDGDAAFATKTLDAPQSDLYYRVTFKLLDQGTNPVTLLGFSTASAEPIVSLQVDGDGRLSYRNAVTAATSTSAMKVTGGVWHEVEVRVRTGAPGEIAVWYDGEPIETLSGSERLGTKAIGRVILGETTPGRSYDLVFDDVAVDTSFIPAEIDAGDGDADTSPRMRTTAEEPAGSGGDAMTTAALEADTTPPETTIGEAPADPTRSANATFSFSSDDAEAKFECRLDATDEAGWGSCSSPTSNSNLTDGQHTFAVRATDAAGNADPTPASHTWTIDTIAPTVDGISPADESTDAAETANVEATFAEEMDAATLTTDTFTLARQDGGLPVAATVTYNAAARTASLDPDAALAAGTIYTATVKGGATGAKDQAGNPLAADHAWSFAVADLTPPETTIDDQPADSTTSAEATFAFSSEVGATFACRLDGEAWAGCTSPTTVTGLVDGSHTFEVRATDAADNTDPTPASHTWTVDTTAPETTIDDAPADPTDQTGATLTFSSTDPGASFACRLDGGDYAACISPKEYTGLAEGSHTFEVRATDAAGNVDQSPATYTWTITAPADTTAPTVIGVAPADGATGVAVADDVSATFAEAMDPATLTPQTFTLRPQGGQAIAAQVSLNAAGTTATLDPEAELDAGTTYTATVEGGSSGATDAAGNPLASDHAWSFTTVAPADTAAPETTIDEAPDNPSGSPEATFAFSADDPGATFECQLDAVAYEPCASPTSYSNLTDGEHTFAVRATDAAGNTDATPAIHTWIIDATGPETTIDGGPSDLTSSRSATFSFSSSEGIATFACSLDGAAFGLCISPAEYTGLAEGQHDFQVQSTDLLGNTDPTPATRTWTVDSTPPTVGTVSPPHEAIEVLIDTNVDATFVEPMDPASLTTGSFTLAPEGGGAVAATVAYDEEAKKATLDPDADLELGTVYTATVTSGATDAAGNGLAAEETWSFTTAAPLDTTAPETAIDGGPDDPTTETTARNEVTVDTTAPTVTGIGPADGATGVAPSANVAAIFSEAMDAATISPSTFTLVPQSGGAAVAAVVAYNATTQKAVLDPETDLASGTSYTATVTTGATDLAGNPLVADKVWSFTTDGAGTLTFAADADAEVRNDFPSSNYGASNALTTDGSPIIESYLRFAVNGVGGTVTGATLRLYATNGTTAVAGKGPAVYPAANDWNEGTVTWTTKPARSSTTAADVKGAVAVNTWTEFDVTSLVSGNGAHTFNVAQISSDAVSFYSKNETTNATLRPQLVLTVQGGGSAVETTIDSGPQSPTNDIEASFTFSANDPGATFACSLDGGSWAACTSPATFSVPTEGAHAFEVRASDLAGNGTDPTPARHEWTVDTTAPTVTTAAPAEGATGVAVNADVAAAFAETMDAATLTTATFTLVRQGDGTPVAATVSYDAATKTAILDPEAALAVATTFTAMVTTGTRDLAGNPLAAEHAWSFTTVATVDSTPPTVTGVAPTDGTTAVAVGANVAAAFSEAMDSATLTTDTFTLVPQGGVQPVAAAVRYDAAAKKAVLDPVSDLAAGTTYTATVKGGPNGAKDAAGNALAADRAWIFATAGSGTLTFVPEADTRVNKASPSTNYGTSASLVTKGSDGIESYLRFAVSGVAGTVTKATLRLYAYDASVDGAGVYPAGNSWNEGTINWNTKPARSNATATDPKGQIAKGWVEFNVTALVSADGTYTFNLAPPSASTSTDGAYFYSKEEATNTTLRPQLVVTVQDAASTIDTRVDSGPRSLTNSIEATFAFSASEPGATFECALDGAAFAACASPQEYAVGEGSHAFQVRAIDLAGTPDASPATHTWVVDTTAPAVATMAPAEGATGVAVGSNVEAALSEAMDAATLTTATFTLVRQDGGTPVAATVSYDAANKTAILDPEATLASGTTYTASVTTGATDLAGNPLAAEHAWSFATAATADTTPPAVVSVLPADGAASVAVGSNVEAAFSEAMDAATISPSTFTLVPQSGGAAVAAAVSYDAATMKATLNPDADLASGTTYTATVTTGATDLAGNPLAANRAWSFATQAAVLTPAPEADAHVASASPTTNFGAATTLVADSSPNTESYLRFVVSGGTGAVASATLRLFVRDGTNDGPTVFAAGDGWDEGTVTWDTKPVRVGAAVANAGVLASNTWVEYDVTALVTSRGTYNFVLVPESGDQVTFTSRNSGTTTQRPQLVVTLDPNAPSTKLDSAPSDLTRSTTATFAFSANEPDATFECTLDGSAFTTCASPQEYAGLTDGSHTFQVRAIDAVGNADPTPATRAWTVDTTAPTVTDVAPVDGALGLAVGGNVVANFSEAMDSASLTSSTVTLAPQGGSQVVAAVVYDAETQKVTLNPNADLAPETTYTAIVTAGAKDAAGNALASAKSWSFTTAGLAKSSTLAPTADATIESANPTTNYGTRTTLKVDSSPQIESLLRFTVAGYKYGATSVRLRLYTTDGTDDGPAVYAAGTTWNESTVTWNTKPARDRLVSDTGAITTSTWVEYDVSSLVKGDGTYTFALVAESSNSATFASREATASRRPQLVVDYNPATLSVQASPGGGTYTESQTVTLTAAEPSTIWFSTDGTDPSNTGSHTRHIYTGPLVVPVTTTLKFVAITADGRSSPVVTEAYKINVTTGYRDFYYGGTGVTEATADKTESKLWFHDGSWWGSLYSNSTGEYRIHRFDGQGWVDTGITIDVRENSRADVLWDGSKLYVASGTTVVSEFSTPATDAELAAGSAELRRFSYNPILKTYTLDLGFPVTIRSGSAESMTLAKDSTGQLWITFTRNGQVWVNRSLGSDTKWGEAFVPPVAGVAVHHDDISAIIAFGGDRVGMMWSNQNDKRFYFAVHRDADPDDVWQVTETAHGGGQAGCGSGVGGTGCANDHLNLKATSDGRVFAGIKTANRTTGQPMVRLAIRGVSGGWSAQTFSNVEDEQSRPRVLIDEGNGWVYVLVTKPELGAAIFYKRANLNSIAFDPGPGTSLIQMPTDRQINNATSTKQNLSSGFLVLASDTGTKYYQHNLLGP